MVSDLARDAIAVYREEMSAGWRGVTTAAARDALDAHALVVRDGAEDLMVQRGRAIRSRQHKERVMPYETKAVVSLKAVVGAGKTSKYLSLAAVNGYQVVDGKVKLTIFVNLALATSATPNPTTVVVAFPDDAVFDFDSALEGMLTQAALAGTRIGLTVDPVPTPPKITGVTIPAAS